MPMLRTFSKVRLYLICFAALALALPMAVISLAKILLLLGALTVLLRDWQQQGFKGRSPLSTSKTTPMVLLALALMLASSLLSSVALDQMLPALLKHSRLLLIPIVLCLTRSRQEALLALAFFVAGQVFLLCSTWLLFMGIPIPWVISKEAGICANCSFAIFSSYLDQSIMTAVLAAVIWHLRIHAPQRYRTSLAAVIVGLALTCVFFIFQGRTGHVVAITLITLAIVWESPKHLRWRLVLIPLALLIALAVSSSKVSRGLKEIGEGIQSFQNSGQLSPRSGVRLDLWRRSLQSIAENPWQGSGVGSWRSEFERQQALHSPATPISNVGDQHQNPHQEFLLWGVELGLPGIVLLCAVLLTLYRDSQRLQVPERRAMQSVLAALVAACLFNCTLYDSLIGDFFCITLGLLLALGGSMPAPPTAAGTAV